MVPLSVGCPSPVSGWPVLLELKMRKEVASEFFSLGYKLHGACVPAHKHIRVSGAAPPRACSQTARPPKQQERTFFLWESLNERPVCSQSESFGFGKVSSFQQWRVGTRKKLNDTRERRSESEGRWEGIGVTKGCTAAPLSPFPNLTGHLVCQTLPELPVAAPGRPGGGLLLLRKTELAGGDVGLNLSWDWGRRDHGSSQSLCAQPGSCLLRF